MSCVATLSGITTSCGSNIPSIKSLWIGQFESANFVYTYLDETDADGIQIKESVTSATLVGENTQPWVEFQFRKNTGEMTSEMTVNENGSHFFTNSANLVFARIDNSKRLALESVGSGECSLIVLDSNNQYWLIGAENSVTMTTLSATTGVSVSDNNQYSITLSAEEPTMPILIEKENAQTIIDTLTGVTVGGE